MAGDIEVVYIGNSNLVKRGKVKESRAYSFENEK